jgi:4-aminobutyrate aminotransferase-like enzyme
MGNGFPIGGVICRTELAEAIEDAKLFSTFGGNPPAAAAGLAVLEVIDQDGLVERAATMGQRLREGLQRLVERHGQQVTHVSGRGLFLGLHLRVPEDGSAHPHMSSVLELCRQRGLVIGKGGRQGNVLRCVEDREGGGPGREMEEVSAAVYSGGKSYRFSLFNTLCLPRIVYSRFKPPLCVSEDDIDEAVSVVDSAIRDIPAA